MIHREMCGQRANMPRMNTTVGITIVDAFTDRAFAGNPAAICVLDGPADEVWMKLVAREMNLSETAFLHPEGEGWRLRWLTPTVEVDLCGHATLAAAHVLWQSGRLAPDEAARFETRSGSLFARQADGMIELDLPSRPAAACDPPAELLAALGASAVWVGKNVFDYCIEVADEAAVRALAPDHAALAKLAVRGVIVTARATTPGIDFVSRFFAPGSGIPEDPVTGSAHCCLGPLWAERLGRRELRAAQVSPRGGFLRVTVAGDRVRLAGHAVTVLEGQIRAAK
jgi:predicted PhzF superfamily epimerase YddE/YHI9